jgi:alkylation response protein AidB-like acyl-CoA dehydrogenase
MSDDPRLTDEQRRYVTSVVEFATGELRDDLTARDRSGTFGRDLWDKCARFGIQGLPVPSDQGGSGADVFTTILALEALGYGCEDNGLLFSLGAQMWSFQMPLLRYGTDEQKKRYLPGICDGSLIGVHAMTEPDSGSDAFSLKTTATRDGDSYVLNGSKTFVTNAPVADAFVVFASTDPSQRFGGITPFLVDAGIQGLAIGESIEKMGLRTSPMGTLYLSDCRIPASSILAGEGTGMVVFNSSLDWERAFILAPAAGTMRRQIDKTSEYARERKQFGHPIGDFQAVSHKIAEMRVRLASCRALLYEAAHVQAGERPSTIDAAVVKLHISESFVASSLDAMGVFGGYGYTTEYGIEREVRDALASRIYSGTSDIQKNIIAGQLGL